MSVLIPQSGVPSTPRTLTQRLLHVRPGRDDLVDAGLLVTLLLLGLWGFGSTFTGQRYIVVGGAGALLGVALAHLAQALRWPFATTAVTSVAAFFTFGGLLALRADPGSSLLPGPAVWAELSRIGLHGWKELLTTLPPVDSDSHFVVIPYLIGLFAAAAGYEIARRTRSALAPLVVPALVVVLVLLLGTAEPVAEVVRGIGLAGVAFAWAHLRQRRRGRLRRSGGGSPVTRAIALGLALASVGVAWVSGPLLRDPSSTRLILRDHVQPPFDIAAYPSPLASFARYTQGAATREGLYGSPLLHVRGLPAGSLLRIAVLDDYDSQVWSAAPTDPTGTGAGAFRQVGQSIRRSTDQDRATSITVAEGYTRGDLAPWLPAPGPAAEVVFVRGDVAGHRRTFRYNLDTGQGILPDRLRTGDEISVNAAPVPLIGEHTQNPYGALSLSPEAYGFVGPRALAWSASAETPWEQLRLVMAQLRRGFWSDGTRAGEELYWPGHGLGRLGSMLNGQQLVGSDEQYAAVLALMANQIGFPARVVFGAVVPADGAVSGKDITAWVEIRVSDGGWLAIPPSAFIPDQDRRPDPDQQPQPRDQPQAAVPPPNVTRPTGTLDELIDTTPAVAQLDAPRRPWWERVPPAVWLTAKIIGTPLVLSILIAGALGAARGIRTSRRRTRGSPRTQLAMGWAELVDRARDLGRPVPLGATRHEQSRLLGDGTVALASIADRATFAPDQVDDAASAAYWQQIDTAQQNLRAESGRRARLRALFSVTSLSRPAAGRSLAMTALRRVPQPRRRPT